MLHSITRLFSPPCITSCIRTLTSYNDAIPAVTKEQIGSCGVLSLHRPKVMNALNIEVFDTINPQLIEWERDLSIKSILVRGRDENVFSAGGEIKKVLDIEELDEGELVSHLSKEYALVHLFSMLRTPCISLWRGITMGGGVGIAYHSRYRIASENTICSLPETALGFFPDVGATFFLPRLPRYTGMYLGLTGHQLKGKQVVLAGLATHFIPTVDIQRFVTQLSSLENSRDVNALVNNCGLLDTEYELGNIDKIEDVFHRDSVEAMLERLSEIDDDWSQKTKARLLKMSPTALKVTHRALCLGGNLNLKECLLMEANVSLNFTKNHDLFVGLKGVLVDKVKTRLDWDPATLDNVSDALVMSHFVNTSGHVNFFLPSVLRKSS